MAVTMGSPRADRLLMTNRLGSKRRAFRKTRIWFCWCRSVQGEHKVEAKQLDCDNQYFILSCGFTTRAFRPIWTTETRSSPKLAIKSKWPKVGKWLYVISPHFGSVRKCFSYFQNVLGFWGHKRTNLFSKISCLLESRTFIPVTHCFEFQA